MGDPRDTVPPLSADDTWPAPPPELASTIPSPPPDFQSHPFYPIALDDESLEDD